MNLEKLDRLEDRAACAGAMLRDSFDRYRSRMVSASQRRAEATENAHHVFRVMTLSELASVSTKELQAGGVNVEALNAALRDRKAADELRQEHERQAAASRDLIALVRSLRTFAGRA